MLESKLFDNWSNGMALEIHVLNARHLPKMDTFGSCDAFVILQIGDSKFETSVKKGSYSPDWNEIFLFSARPSQMNVDVYDWNRTSKNEKVLHKITMAKMLKFVYTGFCIAAFGISNEQRISLMHVFSRSGASSYPFKR